MQIIFTAAKQLALVGKREHIHIFKRFLQANKWLKKIMPGENLPPHRKNPVIKILDTPEFKSIFTPELETLADMFKRHKHELRIAGGAVRDILMGINPKDVDFATTATPNQMKEMFEKEEVRMINTNGEKHGTVTSRINDKENFEVTTLRVDVATDGRHANVEFTTDWLLDASRRDLTINSMFLDLDGKVYDYFYGYDHLMQKKVTFVGDPARRIEEDFLRIFRYFRFYGRIADTPDNHDEQTIQAIKDNVEGLQRISGERMWTEWNRILQGNFYKEMTTMLIDCGCAKYMGLPENPNVEHFYEICKKAEDNNVKLRSISRAAALLNSQEEVLQLFMKLRFSNIDRNIALFIVENRDDDLLGDRPLKKYQSHVLKTIDSIRDLREMICEFLRYKGALKLLEEFEKWDSSFPVSGSMLKPYLGNKNQLIGIIISKLKDIWVDSDFQMTGEELLKYVPEMVEDAETEFQENLNKRKQKKMELGMKQKALKKSKMN
ncbi:CCA tRNA nucleotidyltransferase 1, mitochondrial [Copidosoma floridanum]|uniref:CCA tRNA nucleotidyltransferase 1, mitochondrial n=1 Tax=Copidosoma floridanum TaxID=29053 RepID=UPI0006C99123|nr:CCA tRNA nucleotidyltransferase 1, mitochondrial [Copidosoma floridanum]